MNKPLKQLLPVAPVLAAIVFAATAMPSKATADAQTDAKEKQERCATRVSIAMIGEGASAELLASTTPQTAFDTLVNDPKFQERFSRFINSEFNRVPGDAAADDAAYYMTKYILTNKKPWQDAFIGPYDVVQQGNDAAVVDNPNGLGYFRSRNWMVRYAGNEPNGIRIVTAYRMLQNTTGLALTASTNAPDADITANGRMAAQCAGCHYNNWYALDKTASVLGTRTGMGAQTQFQPSTKGPQQILGGVTVSNDKELVTALVSNEAFNVNACRLAFKYLYGRAEYSCEGPVFDACVDAFKKDKTITSALGVVVKDPAFCEQ